MTLASKTKKKQSHKPKPTSTKTYLDLQRLSKLTATDSNKNTEIVQPYVVAIPSYKRPETIVRATLWTLFRGRIPSQRITVFLASADERRQYVTMFQDPINSPGRIAAVLPKSVEPKQISRYTKWLLSVKLVVGHKGLAAQRNFINAWYPSRQHILSMDDDVRQVLRLRVARANPRDRRYWRLEPVSSGNATSSMAGALSDLDALIQSGFKKAHAAGAYLWGVYPVDNAYFMQPNSSQRLKFIVGPMFGVINRPELSQELDITMDEKEDMERTLRYWQQDGAVVRLNYITIRTLYYDTAGGMQDHSSHSTHSSHSIYVPLESRKQASNESARQLHAMFPKLTTLFYRKSGPRKGWAEIRLRGSRPGKLTVKKPSSRVGASGSSAVKYKRRYSRAGRPPVQHGSHHGISLTKKLPIV